MKPRPVTNVNCAVEWSMRSVVIERTKVTLSTTCWKCGSRSETCRPLWPQSLNFQGLAMICWEPLSARPLISKGAGFPSYFHQRGLRVEHVDGARPAADVDEDDALRLGGEVRRLRLQIVHPLLGEGRLGGKQPILLEHRVRRPSRRTRRRYPVKAVYASIWYSWLLVSLAASDCIGSRWRRTSPG